MPSGMTAGSSDRRKAPTPSGGVEVAALLPGKEGEDMASISRSDFARLVLRVGVGGVMAAHGTQKLFGWFGGGGLAGTAGHLESAGFRPGRMKDIVAGVTETAGGVLLAAGLATPSTGAAVTSTMAVAAATHAPQGFFAMKGGYEYP